jgi:ApeA N-terminal domain 1
VDVAAAPQNMWTMALAAECCRQQHDNFDAHMPILEERGLFWWHGEPIEDRHFAPESSVFGLLKIDDDGIATLRLDGDLLGEQGSFDVLSPNSAFLKGKLIEGLLGKSRKHVLLIDLQRYGGIFNSNNVSHGGYRASHCLVSYSYFPLLTGHAIITSIELELIRYEEWLWLNSIETISTDISISVTYRQNPPLSYDVDEGVLKIEYSVAGPGEGSWRDHKLSLVESASLVFKFTTLHTLDQTVQKLRSFEDLLLILTNSTYTPHV